MQFHTLDEKILVLKTEFHTFKSGMTEHTIPLFDRVLVDQEYAL